MGYSRATDFVTYQWAFYLPEHLTMAKSAKLLKRLLSTGKLGAAQEFALQRLEERVLMTANPTAVWTGNGGDNLWSTAANWDTNAVPEAGDDLEFAAGAAQLTSMNDLDAGTHFHAIIFSGAGYTVNGNDIFVHAGISNTSGGTDIYASRLFLLDEGQTMDVSSGSTLILADVVTSFGVPTIEKTGGGKLVVQSPNDLDATFMVSAGTLEINGSQATGVAVSGGTFQGAGTVGGINATGGTVAAIIGSSPVVLTSTGDVAIGSGSTLNAKIDDAAAYSSLSVTGSVTLGGALSLNVGYSATVGDAYTLIANDGADAVVGTFSGLAEGSTVTAAGQRFRISYQGGDGNDVVLTRVQDGSTVTLGSSGATVFGQVVTFTATVAGQAPGAAAPGGTVQFYDGLVAIGGPVTLDGNGQAQVSVSTLTRAGHSITAVYAGTAAYATSTSNTVTQTVAKSSTTIGVTQGSATSVFGETATITAVVAASGNGSGTPTGTVRFLDGVTTLGTVALVNGQASVNLTNLPVGTRTITALYSGSGDFSSSSTPVGVSHTVNEASTVTSVYSNVQTSTYNTEVTFIAHVEAALPGSGVPTGSVTFYDGVTNLGTGSLSNGTAVINVSSLDAGSHTITAVYNDDSNFVTSTSADYTQTVQQMGTSTSVFSDNMTATYGDLVTLSATVTSSLGAVALGSVTFYDGNNLIGSAGLDGQGVATYGLSSLGGGSHTITAVYNGTTNFATSATLEGIEQSVAKATPSVAVVGDTTNATYGDVITYTATVSSSSTTPTGVVNFYDGETLLGSGNLDVNGVATYSTGTLDTGSHTITAAYAGDGDFESASDDMGQTVAIASTTTAVTTSNNHTTYNDSVTYTATVSSGGGTASGSVEFYDGQTLLDTVALDNNGVAELQIRNLGAGSHTIEAVFTGSLNFDSSNDQVAQDVDVDSTTTSAVSSGDTAYGQEVTFTATVTGTNGGVPTGTVKFYDGQTLLGSGMLDEDGVATLTLSTLDVGTYNVQASYFGDDNFTDSMAGQTVAQEVSQALTTVSVSVPSGNVTFGETVTLTATVSSADATPTGSVDFYDGMTLLGSGNLDGNGQATLDVSNLTTGSHSNVYASYAGTSNFGGNLSTPIGIAVAEADTTVSVSSGGTSTYGDSVTLTATVGADHGTPTGTVTFFDGATLLGSDTLNNGQGSITLSDLGAGEHTITAVYGGTADYNGQTSDTFTQTVNKGSVQVWYSIPGGIYHYGDAVTVTATMHTGAGTPTGTVKLMEGDTILDMATLSNGSADLDGSGMTGGQHSLTIVYDGDANFNGNSDGFGFNVDAASTTTTVGVSGNATTYGGQAEFVAAVTSLAGIPTGSVQFYINGDAFGDAVAVDEDGVATLDTNELGAGTHTITAAYLGDVNFDTSSDLLGGSQVVNQASTTVTTPQVAATSTLGESVTISATVSSTGGTPVGAVEFFDGQISLGTANVDNDGVATLNVSSLGLGVHAIHAQFTGSANFEASNPSADATTQVQSETTTAISSNVNPAVHGQPVTLTVTVVGTANGAPVPTGSVDLYDGASLVGTLVLNGQGQATWSSGTLTTGTHSFTAVYAGDLDSVTSTTSSALTQTVNKASTSTAVTVSKLLTVHGESVNLVATVSTVSPGVGAAAGLVQFYVDGEAFGSAVAVNGSGVATLSTAGLSTNIHTITAVYAGNADFTGSADNVGAPEVVSKDPGHFVVTSSSLTSVHGQTVTFTATITATAPGAGTPTGTVVFLDGITPLSQALTLVNGTATLDLSNLSLGSHDISIVYSGDLDFTGGSPLVPLAQVVTTAQVSATVSSSASTSVHGQQITLTANLGAAAPGSGVPTGTVTFKSDGVAIGGPVALVNGVATMNVSSLTTGDHVLTVAYSGDTNFASGSSSGTNQTVGQATADAAVTVSSGTSSFGANVTFTATMAAVAPGAGVPTGTVTFMDGQTVLGTTALVNGSAELTLGTLAVGDHEVTAVYSGDTDFAAGGTSSASVTVSKASTAVAVESSGTSTFGDQVTLTATVTSEGGTATGTVDFYDNDTFLGTGTVDGDGVATLTISTLHAGTHDIGAVYGGDDSFQESNSSPIEQIVERATTGVTVQTTNDQIVYGGSVTLTATVTTAAGDVTGTVTFYDGETALGTTEVINGTASFEAGNLSAGEHMIVAVYGGDDDHHGNQSEGMLQAVSKAGTSSVIDMPHESTYGDNVTLTVTVSSETGTPTGTVDFYDGETLLGTGTVDEEGVASLTLRTLGAGTHSISTVYSGDENHEASSTPTESPNNDIVTVSKATPTVGVTTTASHVSYGTGVTITATLTGTGLVPTGTVTFKDGTTVLGTVNLVNGVATYSTSSLAIGNHSITATFNSNGNYNAAVSTSSPVSVQDVTPPTAKANVKDVTRIGATKMTFSVTYSDASGINGSTLNNNSNAVVVTGPKGFVARATFVSISVGQGGSVTVNYSFTPAGGSWDANDAGTYGIWVLGNVVKDSVGNTMTFGAAGSFYMSPTPFFDERFYLSHNADVAAAVASGAFASGYQHFVQYGQVTGRDPSAAYNEKRYLAFNPDIAAAVRAGGFKSGWDHLMKYGIKEKRKVNAFFDETYYLSQNADVQAAVKAGMYKSGLEHYLAMGQYEGRSPSIYFNDALYRAQNPSVVTAVQAGTYASAFQHFLMVGQQQGLTANNLFSESYYLTTYPDVATLVANHVYKSGLEHYIIVGKAQGKLPIGVGKPVVKK
jgi:hypothetical protein